MNTLTEIKSLVMALEALDGQPWAEPADLARKAIEAAREPAHAAIFPVHVIPLDASAYAAYAFHRDRLPGNLYDFVPSLAALHGRALETFADLAALLRTAEVTGEVRAAAATRAHAIQGDAVKLGNEDAERYQQAIAAQLAAVEGHELAAHGATLVACAEFTRRVDAAIELHKRADAERLAALEARRREADRVRAMESSKRAAEAKAEADRLEQDAAAARQRARLQRAEALADRVRASGRDSLRTSRGVLGVADVLSGLRMMSLVQMDEIEAALERGAP